MIMSGFQVQTRWIIWVVADIIVCGVFKAPWIAVDAELAEYTKDCSIYPVVHNNSAQVWHFIAGAAMCDWLLLLTLLAGVCYVIACSPSPTLVSCHHRQTNLASSSHSSPYFAHGGETLSGANVVCCRNSRAGLVSDMHEVQFSTA